MGVVTPEHLVGLLAEPERLRVVAAVVLGARTPPDIALAAGLDLRVVLKALRRLEAGGLVSSGADGVELHDGNHAGVGDWIVTRRNNRRLSLNRGRDWVRNVLAHGGCDLIRGGRQISLTAPILVRGSEGWRLMPRAIRPVLQLLGVTEFLRLRPSGRHSDESGGR